MTTGMDQIKDEKDKSFISESPSKMLNTKLIEQYNNVSQSYINSTLKKDMDKTN